MTYLGNQENTTNQHLPYLVSFYCAVFRGQPGRQTAANGAGAGDDVRPCGTRGGLHPARGPDASFLPVRLYPAVRFSYVRVRDSYVGTGSANGERHGSI